MPKKGTKKGDFAKELIFRIMHLYEVTNFPTGILKTGAEQHARQFVDELLNYTKSFAPEDRSDRLTELWKYSLQKVMLRFYPTKSL